MSTDDKKPAKQSFQLFGEVVDPDGPNFLPPVGSLDWSEGLINARVLISGKLSDNIHDRKYDTAYNKVSQAMVELSVVLWHISILKRKQDEELSRASSPIQNP